MAADYPLAMATTHVLYLHGFRSSPQSFKARLLASHLRRHHPGVQWWCPQLPPSPQQAVEAVLAGIAAWPHDCMAVAGSSLGGFYATVVAEHTGCRAVLLNPAVQPARDLQAYIGIQTAWHDAQTRFEFLPRHVQELRALTPPHITRPERYWTLIAQGDEVLDWREMRDRYASAPGLLLAGSDHAISDFEHYLPQVLAALGLPAPAGQR